MVFGKRAKAAAKAAAAAAAVAALALALAGCSSSGGSSDAGEHGITVQASSEAKVVPDKARVSVSVVTEAKTAEQCQGDNAESVNAVIAAIQALGVADDSIQTTYSNLSPRYGSRTSEAGEGGEGDEDEDEDVAYDDWAIVGYEMSTSLSISDLDISNVGAIVEECVAAGANEADGVEYYASNYDDAYNEALAEALGTAKSKAEGIASSAGVSVGKVVNVTEGYQDTSTRYAASYDKGLAMGDGMDESASIAQTMPGQVTITAQVTVTYAIS